MKIDGLNDPQTSTPEDDQVKVSAACADAKLDGDFPIEGDSGALTTGGQAHLPPPPPGRR